MKLHKMQSSTKQNKLDLKNKNKRCIENLYMEKKNNTMITSTPKTQT
jgi:hypothetical protein